MAMHIHMIRTHYPHWSEHSGIHQFVQYIERNLYSIEESLVSDNDEDFPVQNRIVRKWLRTFVQWPGMEWYKLSDLAAEFRAFRQYWFKQVDIIHYLDGEHSAQFVPRLCKHLRRERPKIVATYHQPPQLLDSLVIKDVILGLDCITVVSPDQVSYLREFVSPEKIRLILHGINVDFFRPGNTLKGDLKFKCITVGNYLRDFKAVRKVAERLSKRGDIEFHVVSSQATELVDLQNVTLYNNIGDDTLLKLYQQSDILFLPMLQSTANNALLEGIACGLPVVSTCLPSIRLYLSGRESILVEDNDPKRLADAILHLVDNHTERSIMGRAARKRAEELDWRNIAPQYEALYSKLINND